MIGGGPLMPMSGDLAEQQLLARAKSGDRVALQELLVLQFQPLTHHIWQRIPTSLQREMDPEDVIGQAFAQVVRDIKDCRAESGPSFFAWVRTIAEHRLQDAIRSAGYRQARGRAAAGPQRGISGRGLDDRPGRETPIRL